jgi:hypothetical protein
MHISTMLLKHVTMAGYFRPPPERPQANNIGFQRPAPNNLPAGAPISGDLPFQKSCHFLFGSNLVYYQKSMGMP